MQAYGNAHPVAAEQDTQWQEEQLQQQAAPTAKRRKRRLRRKRPVESIPAKSVLEDYNISMPCGSRVASESDRQLCDAAHGPGEPAVPVDPQYLQLQDPYHETRPDPSHVRLQSEMEAATIDEYGYHHNSLNECVEIERFDQHNQQAAPMMNYQHFQQPQIRDGSPEMAQDQAEDMRSEQCPSSDILGDAAQQFENRIYCKQKAKSAKHRAERNAWKENLHQQLQAKQTLQERLNVLQREKDELIAAVAKQKAKVAGFEAMASKLKTFINGLANDMGALKRDASNHRQNCQDLGGETRENKAVLDGLLRQLFQNAEKSSQVKNEAIKACHSARSDVSLATERANQLEERLKEKALLHAEEKSFREQIQSQLSSTANSSDAVLRMLKSTEKSVLEKLSELAIAGAAADNGAAISEQLGKTLAAVQRLDLQQTVTVNDIVSVKGIVEQFSESLSQCTNYLQRPREPDSSLKTYINEALGGLKSDLCQQEKLAVQAANNRETISTLYKKVEEVNARMTDCESTLSTTRASEAQLKERNLTLQAEIDTLQSKLLPGEQDSAQLSQLKAELCLKVTAIQTMKSEMDSNTTDMQILTAANGELQAQLNAANLRLKDAPSVKSLEAERLNMGNTHRKAIENARSEATAIITKVKALELSEAANALKKMTADYTKATEKLAVLEKELASSKQYLGELHRKHASDISSMQKKIHSAEAIAADRKKEVDSLNLNLQPIQQAAEEMKLVKAQLSAEKGAVRRAVQDNDSLIEQIRLLRHEHKEDEKRFAEELQQCRADSRELEQRMKAELNAAEERCTEVAKEMQTSAQDTITAEKAKCDRQMEALHKSVQDSQSDLQTRIRTDEEFREELQKSWQGEERRNQAERAQLTSKIFETEVQRDEAVAEIERLRDELAKAHRVKTMAATKSPEAFAQPTEAAVSNDPRLHNRHRQPGDGAALCDTTGFSQASDPAPTRGLNVEESQQALYNASNTWQPGGEHSSQRDHSPALSGPHSGNVEQFSEKVRPRQSARGSTVEESQQHLHPTASQLQTSRTRLLGTQSERNNEEYFLYSNSPASPTVLVQSTSHARQHATSSESQFTFRGLTVEESQQHALPPSQEQNRYQQGGLSHHQSSALTRNVDWQTRSLLDAGAETETQFVPETQFVLEKQTEMPSFAKFHAASTRRKDAEHGAVSSTFNPPGHVDAPRHFQKSMPPPNTATRMVRTGTDSSSLSSLSQDQFSSSPSAAVKKTFSIAATRYQTPEAGSLGGKAQATQSIVSGSSPGFVEQMANPRSRNTYHAGGSGNKAGTNHHSNNKESRTSAPKRKAESQLVQGYEQERKIKSVNRNSRGHEPSRSSQNDGCSLSQLVSSQNRALQTPGSSRGVPRASAQPARMQTLAGTSSTTSTRQTRNTTRKLSKSRCAFFVSMKPLLTYTSDDEMSARFAQELNAAR